MEDAIGHLVEINDYVTAVWECGKVALFQVVGFKNKKTKWAGSEEMFELKRTFKSKPGWISNPDYESPSNKKPVFKLPSQVTWVDPQYVVLHFLKS